MAKNFLQLFSPEAKWCCPEAKGWCPEGKSIEFFFSHSNFVLRSRKKTQWTFLQENTFFVRETKLNWLSFMTPAFCFRRNKVAKKIFFFRNSSSFQWSRGKTKHQSQFSWNSNFWGICLFLYCEPALFQYILLPDEADFFSFLLNFKCRHWRFICFTASKEKRYPMIEQHLN